MPTTILWFRRDLRLHDHPALHQAVRAADGGLVLALFIIDPAVWQPAGPARRAWLLRSLRALDATCGGHLVLRQGRPQDVLPQIVAEVGATSVHATADAGPYGRARDHDLSAGLSVPLAATGTPYAVGPGSILKADGSRYQVFTPFARAWRAHGWPAPAGPPPPPLRWAGGAPSVAWPTEPDLEGVELPEVGEAAATVRWAQFLEGDVANYDVQRDRPDVDGTSALSAHLKYGEIHPRTLLHDLAGRRGAGAETFRTELAWREFYADVLWHRPDSARASMRPQLAKMACDAPGLEFDAWQHGRTGFPFVDAGMRQLRAVGWMHNRLRMVTASFLVKDLHITWQLGARYFLHWLRDGDLASNNHGWQWVAGTGADAAPYFRVFNPVAQGQRFDPDGAYVRRWIPELAHLPGADAHTPWTSPHGYDQGYPERIVDHAEERREALRRYGEAMR